MGIRTAGHETEQELTVWLPRQYLGKQRRGLVVAHDQVVTGTGIYYDPRVTKMPMHDTRLVLLVVVDPQLYGRLSHKPIVPLNGPARSQGSPPVARSTNAATRTARASHQETPPSSDLDS